LAQAQSFGLSHRVGNPPPPGPISSGDSMRVVVLLSFAVWLAASAPSVTPSDITSPALKAICADEDSSVGQISLLQMNHGKAHSQASWAPFHIPFVSEYKEYYSPGAGSLGHAVPSFEVNLDQAPESRWNGVLDYFLDTGLLHARYGTGQPDPTDKMDPLDKAAWIDAIKADADEDFKREAAGIAAYVKSRDPSVDLTEDSILMENYDYEQNYPTYCSGVLAAMTDGTVIQGRNMDYPLEFVWKNKTVGWPELTVEVIFSRGGKRLFTSVTWPGQLGIHTAMRFGGWSIQQNTRRLVGDMRENLAALQQGGKGYGLFVRRLMEQVPDFETAVQTLWNASLAASQYFIMSGSKPYEGAVLSVDRLGQHLVGSPPLIRLSQNKSSWHLVQTNEDLNHPPPHPFMDHRRVVEELRLKKSEQALVNTTWMIEHMRRWPVMNTNTAFTWIGIPATDYYQTILPPGTIDPAIEPTQ